MNRQQALKYDNDLKEKLQSCSKAYNEDEAMGRYIVDNFVEFLPDDDVKGMIFLGNDSVSYKASNTKLDLKKALLAGVEFVTSINSPESIFNYIQLLFVSALFIRNATRKSLSKIESYMVYWLHSRGAYQIGVNEEHFIREFQKWYHQKEKIELEREKVVNAINRLYEMKIADFENGSIYLKEKVLGKLA